MPAKRTTSGARHELTCEECGQPYVTWGPRTRFCTRTCYEAFRRRQPKRPKRTQGELACLHCGRSFVGQNVDFRTRPKQVYCSRVCYNAVRVKQPTFICEHCGQVTARRKNRGNGGYRNSQRFCSRACANTAQRTGWTDKHGYRGVTIDGRNLYEHRLVMERVLGRPLRPYETVHHRDGDRLNNAPENLEVWTGRHGGGQRLQEVIAWAVQILTDNGYQVTPP